MLRGSVLTLALLIGAPAIADDQPLTVDIKRLSLDTALTVAKATLEHCREQGVQVAVTVVDRGGHPQVVLRDVLAMPLTLEISYRKAYTAMSFNTATSQLDGDAMGALARAENVMPSAGGLPIAAAGTIMGGVGVSGAPSGETDEACAQAGVDAVLTDLEMDTM